MPAMPGAGFVVIEAELVLCGLEAVFDRPAVAFDCDECLDTSAGRTPRREESEIAVADIAADEKPAGPNA